LSYAFEKSGEEEVYIHENSTKCLRAGKKSIGTNWEEEFSGGIPGEFRGKGSILFSSSMILINFSSRE